MQVMGEKPKDPSRRQHARARALFTSAAAMCLGALGASAQTTPALVVSQTTQFGATFPTSGGFTSAGSPAGGSFGVTQQGDVVLGLTYGTGLEVVNGVTGAETQLAGFQSAGVTVDSQNNLYFSEFYSSAVVKVPFVNGAYPAQPSSISNCQGGDTTWCKLPFPGANVKAMAVDAAGDVFMVTIASPGNSIYELPANTYTGTPTKIFTDANPISSIALDSKGNLFYTDASFSDSAQTVSTGSTLNELTLSGTTYSTTPTLLVSYTDTPAAQYDSVLSGVAVDANNTVYFADQSNGTFAFPDTGTLSQTSVASTIYQVSKQGGYQIAVDGKGNLYSVAYNNGATVFRIALDHINAGTSALGTAATATFQVFSNGSCGTGVTFANANGSASKELTATTGSTCTSQATYAATSNTTGTVSFTAAGVGERTGLLTATSAASRTPVPVAVTGIGQGALLSLDPGVMTAYTTGFTSPTSVSPDMSGNLFVADAGAASVFEIPAGSAAAKAPTAIGTGFTAPSGTTLDSAGNLFIADAKTNQIVEIPSVAGVLTPASQAVVIASTATFDGTALKAPTLLAAGPNGTLYIYDSGNNRIVSYAVSGVTGNVLAGLPAAIGGMTVDASGDLYVSIPSMSEVLAYQGGAMTTLTDGFKTPEGLAVDAAGDLLVADSGLSQILLVQNVFPASATAKTTVTAIETTTAAPGALSIDGSGNLYTTESKPAGVVAIQRTAAAVNFGGIQPGSTSSLNLYAINSGNTNLSAPTASASLAGTPFMLSTTCGTASTLTPGTSCSFTAGYAPSASASGPQNASGTITVTGASNISTATIPVTLTGNAEAAPGSESQTITFYPPVSTTSITYTSTPFSIHATASSGLPVTITVTGPATYSATSSSLTLTGALGQVTVTASQSGFGAYAAATPVTYTFAVTAVASTPVPAPTFSLNGGTITYVPQTTTISDAQAGATILYTTDGSNPATSPTAMTYSGAITISGTETINAIATVPGYTPSSEATATYTLNAQPASFSLAVKPTPLSIPSAQQGAIDVVVTGANGFNGKVNLTVSGLPSGATAAFSPATLSLAAGAAGTYYCPGNGSAPSGYFTTANPVECSVLTIVTAGAPTTAPPIPGSTGSTGTAQLHSLRGLAPGVLLAGVFGLFGWRRRRGVLRALALVLVGLVGVQMLSGCGSSGTTTTSTVTVTATSGSLTQTATFQLTITPK